MKVEAREILMFVDRQAGNPASAVRHARETTLAFGRFRRQRAARPQIVFRL